jgi:hypothetical protein
MPGGMTPDNYTAPENETKKRLDEGARAMSATILKRRTSSWCLTASTSQRARLWITNRSWNALNE